MTHLIVDDLDDNDNDGREAYKRLFTGLLLKPVKSKNFGVIMNRTPIAEFYAAVKKGGSDDPANR